MDTALRAALLDANKKKLSLSISEPLAILARTLDINLSRAAEKGILQEVQRRRDEAWLTQNQAAIEAYNERIEKDGLFGDEHRNF